MQFESNRSNSDFNPTETTNNLTNTINSVVHKSFDKVMGEGNGGFEKGLN